MLVPRRVAQSCDWRESGWSRPRSREPSAHAEMRKKRGANKAGAPTATAVAPMKNAVARAAKIQGTRSRIGNDNARKTPAYSFSRSNPVGDQISCENRPSKPRPQISSTTSPANGTARIDWERIRFEDAMDTIGLTHMLLFIRGVASNEMPDQSQSYYRARWIVALLLATAMGARAQVWNLESFIE